MLAIFLWNIIFYKKWRNPKNWHILMKIDFLMKKPILIKKHHFFRKMRFLGYFKNPSKIEKTPFFVKNDHFWRKMTIFRNPSFFEKWSFFVIFWKYLKNDEKDEKWPILTIFSIKIKMHVFWRTFCTFVELNRTTLATNTSGAGMLATKIWWVSHFLACFCEIWKKWVFDKNV